MAKIPNWFNEQEYADFLAESSNLFEMNVPLQKQKYESRKKIREFDRQTAIRRINLKRETLRDEGRAKARGIQMGLGEGFIKERLTSIFLNKLAEEKNPIKFEKGKMRPEVDPADKERDRKRESRRQESQESQYKRIIVVKDNRRNKIEIIPKDDYDPNHHTVLKGRVKKIDKGNVTPRDVRYYSKMDNFINTKTSVRLIGKVTKQTEEKPLKKKSMKKQSEKKESDTESESESTYSPPRIRVPVDGKEITDPNSTYPDWDHDSIQLALNIPANLSVMNGQKVPDEFVQTLQNSRTLGDSLNRFSLEIINEYPQLSKMKFVEPDPVAKTGKVWSKMGITESSPNATFIGYEKQNKQGVGFLIKIGEQIRPGNKFEANASMISTLASLPQDELQYTFNLFMDDLMENLRIGFSYMPTPPPVDMIKQTGSATLARQKWQKETIKTQKQKLLDKLHDIFERFVNENEMVKSAFILECLSGNIKFDGGLGSAQMLMTAKKDGSDAAMTQIDLEFTDNLAKSQDTDISLTFTKKPPSEGGFLESILNRITYTLTESAMDAVGEIQKIKNELSNPITFLNIFELSIEDAVYRTPILYSDFIQQIDPDTKNIIIFNYGSDKETEIEIPVKLNYNPQGKPENTIEKGADNIFEQYLAMNDYLVEQIKQGNIGIPNSILFLEHTFNDLLEDRNYRQEYDNYHGKPEQRANRSKRVLARRKKQKKGEVSKGDGKDVHHIDGNPQNNSDDNLKVLPKSKNRSMNEDHGAGFEGTDTLVNNLVDQTPFAVNPLKARLSKYIEDRYVKKIKKK